MNQKPCQLAKRKQPPVAVPHPCVAELAAVKRRLQRETGRRKKTATALKENKQRSGQLLAQSRFTQEQLRNLSHQVLLAQEEERKLISRELHEQVSQILTGISVRLAALKIKTPASKGSLKKKIVNTQRLVEKSVEVVHRFAGELRPAMLDELGLIPTLLSFMKEFRKQTGLQIRFTSVTAGKIEPLCSVGKTMLYRIAQEALANVAKHAQASQVKVSIERLANAICMTVSDNGKSFDAGKIFSVKQPRYLGVLGMRERVKTVGGTFSIESAPGKGTVIRAQIPLHHKTKEQKP